MNWVKGFALATCLAAPISVIVATSASAEPAATLSAETKKPSKEALAKCTNEANAKGLFVKSGKGAERKEFRRTCVRKAMGLDK